MSNWTHNGWTASWEGGSFSPFVAVTKPNRRTLLATPCAATLALQWDEGGAFDEDMGERLVCWPTLHKDMVFNPFESEANTLVWAALVRPQLDAEDARTPDLCPVHLEVLDELSDVLLRLAEAFDQDTHEHLLDATGGDPWPLDRDLTEAAHAVMDMLGVVK